MSSWSRRDVSGMWLDVARCAPGDPAAAPRVWVTTRGFCGGIADVSVSLNCRCVDVPVMPH